MREQIIPSFDGKKLYVKTETSNANKAIVVIVHGLCEHQGRYDYFAQKLLEIPGVVAERHRGLFVGAILEDGISSVEVKRACVRNKFLVTAIGTSIIRMVPPLTITKENVDEACVRLAKAIAEVKG